MKQYTQIFRTTLLAVCVGLCLASCEKDYDTPDRADRVRLETNSTIKELKALYNGTPTIVTDDVVVWGVVTSTDQYGSNYRILCIQDDTAGLEIKLGARYSYTTYQPGDTIYVKAQGLCLGAYRSYVTLGVEPAADSSYENDYLDTDFTISRSIFRGYSGPEVTPIVLSSASDLSNSLLSMRVTIKDAVYSNGDVSTWAYDKDNNPTTYTATSQYFYLGSTSVQVRTSIYASFALDPVPAVGEAVDITGTLTVYNTSYQMVLNNSTDVK